MLLGKLPAQVHSYEFNAAVCADVDTESKINKGKAWILPFLRCCSMHHSQPAELIILNGNFSAMHKKCNFSILLGRYRL